MDNRTTLGSLIRGRRRELGLTQAELAARSSTGYEVVRQSDISRIERGQIQLPRRSRLENIARALDLPLGELLVLSGWAGADQLQSQGESEHTEENDRDWLVSLEQIRDAWGAYQDEGTRFEHLRPVMLEPWKRGQDLGIDPRDVVFQSLPSQEFERRRAACATLITIAHPHLERLSWTFSGKPHIVALVDRDGWTLDLLGTVEEYGGKAGGLAVGMNWSEQSIGNSGVGTCLTTGDPVLVYGIEFEAHTYRPSVCFGVPIHYGGEIIASIGIRVPQEHAEPERLNLAQVCAHTIEAELAEASDFPPPAGPGGPASYPQSNAELSADSEPAGG